jgi:hypothetical protein
VLNEVSCSSLPSPISRSLTVRLDMLNRKGRLQFSLLVSSREFNAMISYYNVARLLELYLVLHDTLKDKREMRRETHHGLDYDSGSG